MGWKRPARRFQEAFVGILAVNKWLSPVGRINQVETPATWAVEPSLCNTNYVIFRWYRVSNHPLNEVATGSVNYFACRVIMLLGREISSAFQGKLHFFATVRVQPLLRHKNSVSATIFDPSSDTLCCQAVSIFFRHENRLKRDHNKTSESIESAKLRKREEKANLLFRTFIFGHFSFVCISTCRCCLHGKINVYESNASQGKVIVTRIFTQNAEAAHENYKTFSFNQFHDISDE